MTDNDRTYSAQLNRSGAGCSSCGCAYDQCTNMVLSDHRACCGTCSYTDTHQEQAEAEPAALQEVPLYIEGAVSLHSDRTLRIQVENATTHKLIVEFTLTGQQVFDLLAGGGARVTGRAEE